MQFELHPEARREFLAAVSRYETEVPGLGARFVAEIERCLSLLLEAPQIGSPLGPRLRRFVVDDGFPFSIICASRPRHSRNGGPRLD
jgi:hypothetical protein